MSAQSTGFTRQMKSEMTKMRTDSVGNSVLLLTFLGSVAWGVFNAYITIAYQDPTEAATNPRVPAGGLAQIGFSGLMVWSVLVLLNSKTKGFWNMRVLVQPRRSVLSIATLVHLTAWSVVFAVVTVLVSTVAAVVVVEMLGHDSSSLIGTPGEVGTVLVQMVGFAVGVTWFTAGWALICNNIGYAISVVVFWPFVGEGMFPSEGSLAWLREFLPFVNALAWYQGDKELQLPWPAPMGLVYFLLLSLILAVVGVWLRRKETLDLSS
ncbi:hypothetical protein CPHO_01445 [Corynebacterium phocae]|uniref:Uncharacterized protein n=1 Tax=Corynebacterium phocae TaxID=161895 RepID=A0A1L7D128_9CORY|nr:hypothetical protein [Corynebacterium phocae]APT91798.1 hypothetical protein CPHO_01445 [Corynebacterium phocae]KAA8728471.1 hypothetical protein F4V58_01000 [Corynebacterium phocae]